MLKQIIKRVLVGVLVLLVLSFLVFMMIHMIPGDPVQIMFGEQPNPEQIAFIQQQYHLDRPVLVQYGIWLANFLKGDMGMSISMGQPVMDLIMERLGRTAVLCGFSIVLSLLIAIPLGIVTAVKNNSLLDLSMTALSQFLLSFPAFFLAIMMILLFSVQLGWLPASGYVSPSVSVARWLRSLIMPVVAQSVTVAAILMRFVRSSVLETMNQDYVMLARAKGNPERRVLYLHTLRNALIPIVTQVGMQMGFLLGGVIVIERVFVYPGLGMLLITALEQRDYPLVQACILVYAVLVIAINIVMDIAYILIDPKISFGKRKAI